MMYSRTYLSKEELESLIIGKIEPLEINRILSSYDMADIAYSDKKSLNGSPYFFHTTRVCKILITELGILDPDLIVSSLLHDICETSEEISSEIIEYNFGTYVAYLLKILKEDYNTLGKFPLPEINNNSNVRIPSDDFLIIWLSEHLDNFRSLEISPLFNPINYILNTLSVLFPAAESSTNEHVIKLMVELKKERNKILG